MSQPRCSAGDFVSTRRRHFVGKAVDTGRVWRAAIAAMLYALVGGIRFAEDEIDAL